MHGRMRYAAVLSILFMSATVRAAAPGPCSPEQLLGHPVDESDTASHRRFPAPRIDYPFDTTAKRWGFDLLLRIDTEGRVTCFSTGANLDGESPMAVSRRALLGRLAHWRYAPFEVDGAPVTVIVSETVAEVERPARRVPAPKAPLADIRMSLSRGQCYGACPSYRIEVRGDGSVIYEGADYADVSGRHAYRVSPAAAAALARRIETTNLWSLRPVYHAPVTDLPVYKVTIAVGHDVHTVEDFLGSYVGMPPEVVEFERAIDEVGRADRWIHLSQEAVTTMAAEGFRFDSAEAGEILFRAVSNEQSHDDAAMRRMIELGAPVTHTLPDETLGFRPYLGSLLEEALRYGRITLVDPLIARGLLDTAGRRDQAKIDSAFRAAIRGGDLASVQRIWEEHATEPHPSLTFSDDADHDAEARRVPVTLLLNHFSTDKRRWQGEAIARWLVERGCDPRAAAADGNTLLHIAASAGDIGMVRYALSVGIAPSTPGRYGLPALGGVDRENIAMLLLEKGTDLSAMNGGPASFRKYAVGRHWVQVVAWIDAMSPAK